MSSIRNINVTVGGIYNDALWFKHGVWFISGDKASGRCELLNPIVSEVSDPNITFRVHRDTRRVFEPPGFSTK